MKQPKTLRHDNYKSSLTKLLVEKPEARLVKNKYKVLKTLLANEWSNSMKSGFTSENMESFLQDVTYCDRMLRKHTEGDDDETKEVLSQDFQLNTLPEM